MTYKKCDKRAFGSIGAAVRTLRLWQRKGRRSAFDTMRPYVCPRCGKVHFGHSDDKGEANRERESKRVALEKGRKRESFEDTRLTTQEFIAEQREMSIGDFEAFCWQQETRIKLAFNTPKLVLSDTEFDPQGADTHVITRK